MSLRAFLPCLLVALGTGYLIGLVLTLRTIDRTEPAGPGDGEAARMWLTRLREDAALGTEDERAAARKAFLARWPDSWLGAHWEQR